MLRLYVDPKGHSSRLVECIWTSSQNPFSSLTWYQRPRVRVPSFLSFPSPSSLLGGTDPRPPSPRGLPRHPAHPAAPAAPRGHPQHPSRPPPAPRGHPRHPAASLQLSEAPFRLLRGLLPSLWTPEVLVCAVWFLSLLLLRDARQVFVRLLQSSPLCYFLLCDHGCLWVWWSGPGGAPSQPPPVCGARWHQLRFLEAHRQADPRWSSSSWPWSRQQPTSPAFSRRLRG